MAESISSLFSTPAMIATFSSSTHVRSMLLFEAALARAESRAGIISSETADAIALHCREEFFDIAALYREAALAGTPAIPLVRMLTARVGGEASKFVHWGATSQDAIDTALMLQMRDGIDLLLAELLALCEACATLATRYRHTPMVGRTLLQQALPITFGLKAARWLALVMRQVITLRERRERTLAVQLGGAAGTLASLGEKGPQVVELLAAELHLPAPELPWHSERDRIAEIAGTLGVIAGSLLKIAGDVVLLAQTEVGEASEEALPGKGGSSAMPQKHNPVDATRAIAAARLAIGEVPVLLSAMAQEHERAAGGWQTEWAAIPNLFCSTAGAAEAVRNTVVHLKIDIARMQANLDLTAGLIMAESLTMALAAHMGRPEAYRIVQDLCKRVIPAKNDLRQLALTDARVCSILSSEEVALALDPAAYTGSADLFIDRALEAYHKTRPA
ncbi:MAG TPA: 3-carboxy-cis,cis-muconate cycloisomerase [Ktedonobacteraceae bacterium]|jgi:3-carboxy-cis,cis-muconate cycloisomerase|nr:3-carboxy-cis,cis-muconate cycloisomerase [Ktedonobacteraceae bacterium]